MTRCFQQDAFRVEKDLSLAAEFGQKEGEDVVDVDVKQTKRRLG